MEGGTIATSAIYLCLPQLSSTLTSPDKPEWIDSDVPRGTERGVDWRCWNSGSDEDEGGCGPGVVFCIRHHLLGQVLSSFKDHFGLSFQLEITTLCSPC